VSILEKAGYDHAKAVAQPDFSFSADDVKNPLVKATSLGGKFYSKVWLKGGQEIADEVSRKNEKESHDALEEAKRVEEVVERARLIGLSLWLSFVNFAASVLTDICVLMQLRFLPSRAI
jgi:hypothetical protein